MACIRVRRGRYVLDYRNARGARTWRSYPLTDAGLREAEAFKLRLEGGGTFNPDTLLGDYAKGWLELVRGRVGELTWAKYEIVVRVHLAPLHKVRVVELTRARLKRFFANLATDLTAKSTAGKALSIMHNLLAEAVDDGALPANPASRLGRHLGLTSGVREETRAMDGGQLAAFLATLRARESAEDALPLVVLAYAGLRIGEMAGLQIADVGPALQVQRQILPTGKVKLPKGNKARTVDVADALRETIEATLASRREYELRTGRRSPWLAVPDLDPAEARPPLDSRVRRTMARVLKAAGLPAHFTPHCLRHTYASLLLQRGESLLYVSRQLGHSSIKMTADVYGKWLPIHATNGGPNLLREQPLDAAAIRGVDSSR